MELLPPLGPHNKPNGLSKNSFQCHISAQGTQRQLSAQSTLTALSCLSSARSPQWGGTQCSAWMGLEQPPPPPDPQNVLWEQGWKGAHCLMCPYHAGQWMGSGQPW